jgi:hypothetical protein
MESALPGKRFTWKTLSERYYTIAAIFVKNAVAGESRRPV